MYDQRRDHYIYSERSHIGGVETTLSFLPFFVFSVAWYHLMDEPGWGGVYYCIA